LMYHSSPASAIMEVSVRNIQVFNSALMPLMEPCTLWRKSTRFPLHTSLLYFADGYAPSERHMSYTLSRGSSYAVALYTAPGDVYAFLRPSATFQLSTNALYRMPHIPHIWLALRCCDLLQYSLRFG
jgi:hypothetical protein